MQGLRSDDKLPGTALAQTTPLQLEKADVKRWLNMAFRHCSESWGNICYFKLTGDEPNTAHVQKDWTSKASLMSGLNFGPAYVNLASWHVCPLQKLLMLGRACRRAVHRSHQHVWSLYGLRYPQHAPSGRHRAHVCRMRRWTTNATWLMSAVSSLYQQHPGLWPAT